MFFFVQLSTVSSRKFSQSGESGPITSSCHCQIVCTWLHMCVGCGGWWNRTRGVRASENRSYFFHRARGSDSITTSLPTAVPPPRRLVHSTQLIKWARSAPEHYFYQKAIFRWCLQVSRSQSPQTMELWQGVSPPPLTSAELLPHEPAHPRHRFCSFCSPPVDLLVQKLGSGPDNYKLFTCSILGVNHWKFKQSCENNAGMI